MILLHGYSSTRRARSDDGGGEVASNAQNTRRNSLPAELGRLREPSVSYDYLCTFKDSTLVKSHKHGTTSVQIDQQHDTKIATALGWSPPF